MTSIEKLIAWLENETDALTTRKAIIEKARTLQSDDVLIKELREWAIKHTGNQSAGDDLFAILAKYDSKP